jgi:hypothetical protein
MFWGRAHKGLGMDIFVGGTNTLQRRAGKSFYTCLSKISHWELASKNQNIRNLKTSRWRNVPKLNPPG